MRTITGYIVMSTLLATLALCLVPMSAADAQPVSGGPLTSGKPVNGAVSSAEGISYTFQAVAGQHLTLAITSPKVSPAGNNLQMQVYDASNATDAAGVFINTAPTEIDFTPTAAEAGTTTVVISPYNAGATGTFTLTYATDVIGTLTSTVPVTGTLAYAGQHADYTFTAVAGNHVTLAITSPNVSPSGDNLQMQVYDASGATDAGGVFINTAQTEIDFTPTAAEAGTTTVVISPYNFETTGSFTLTYAKDVIGTLTSGVPVNGTLAYAGQHADYTFTAVAGKHVTLAITNPDVSPSGDNLQMQVYDASGATDASGVFINTAPTEIDFTPTAAEAGTTTVVISPYNFETTGSFTLTYATDVVCCSPLTSGVPVNGTLAYAGQHADYTFTAVAGLPVTLAITNPDVSPSGDNLQMQVYDASGATDASGVFINTSPTQIVFTPTAAEAGTTTVVISPYNFETTGSFTLTYTTLAVTGVSPTSGPTAGGTTVTITGTEFTGATAVAFGTVAARSFTVVSSTEITAVSPAQAAAVHNILVSTSGGTSGIVTADQFTYVAAPTVTAVSPTSGPTAGGTTVTITGTGFTGATAVTFGAVSARSFTVVSPTQITAVSPAQAAALHNILVTTAGGTSAIVTADQFTYAAAPTVTAVSPMSGPTAGGTTVTMTGTGFSGATAVTFGAVAAKSFTVVSPTEISAVSPAQAAALHNILVTTPGGTSAIVTADQFTYVAAVPTVTAVSPTSGPTAGGTTVTITGTGFSGATAVTFGAVSARSFTVVSPTQITAVSPAQAAAVHNILVTTAGGTSAIVTADQFTYVAAPTVTAVSPTSGPTAGGTTVTVTGTGFSGATAVTFGAVAARSFTVVSPTQITAVSPAQAAAVHNILVTTPGGTSAIVTADQFTYK